MNFSYIKKIIEFFILLFIIAYVIKFTNNNIINNINSVNTNTNTNNLDNISNNTNITNNNNIKGDVNCLDKKIIKIDSLKEHLNRINSQKNNKNILIPKEIIPYNFSKTDNYNIMNNFGVIDLNKRSEYLRSLNKDTISYNYNNLLKNYHDKIDDNFLNITTNYKPKCDFNKKECFKNIIVIGQWININNTNKYSINWSIDSNCNFDSKLYIYFRKTNECKKILLSQPNLKTFNKIKLNYFINKNTIKTQYGTLTQNNYKNRNIYSFIFNKLKKNNHYNIFVLFKDQEHTVMSNVIII